MVAWRFWFRSCLSLIPLISSICLRFRVRKRFLILERRLFAISLLINRFVKRVYLLLFFWDFSPNFRIFLILKNLKMLNKLATQAHKLGRFGFASKSFGNFNELQTFLKNNKPILGCMYFRAKWNPMLFFYTFSLFYLKKIKRWGIKPPPPLLSLFFHILFLFV